MNNFLNAAESHFKALMDEHALTLNLYMTSSVGIGEHPDVFGEFVNAVKKYEDAQSNFNVIQEMKSQMMQQLQAAEGVDETVNED